jgi:hypothetical protein
MAACWRGARLDLVDFRLLKEAMRQSSTNAARLKVRRRWFRWSLHNDRQLLVHLRGITKTEASALSGRCGVSL